MMATDPRLVGYLMRALAHEMAAVQQYLAQASLATMWQMHDHGQRFRRDAEEELNHAQQLIEHLLVLGIPANGVSLPPIRLGLFRDIFSGAFRGGRQEEGPQAGTDLEYQVHVDFWTAIRGGKLRLQITRQVVCPTCHGAASSGGDMICPECEGSGHVTQLGGRMKFNIQCPKCGGTGHIQQECFTCHGQGTVARTEISEFRIKPGTRDGQRIRLAGKGNAGVRGGAAGDLYLIVQLDPHPVFTRKADDIYVTVPVTVTEAALGAKIEVPTIDGRAHLKITPGTQTGQKLRLREKGVPSAAREGIRGDQIVEVRIVVPKIQDERSKEILRDLARLNPEDPRQELFSQV